MSSWKDYPNLFCNGKFKCEIEVNSLKRSANRTKYITNFEGVLNGKMYASVKKYEHKLAHIYPYKITSLVARKIESMTDEENEKLSEEITSDDLMTFRSDNCKNVAYNGLMYLLSIGVYPFDQSHFGKDVIDINEVEK